MNSAFVFIKPHAVTDATEQLVRDTLAANNIEILTSGELTGTEIDDRKLIDQHYYSIASKATLKKPAELPVPADQFAEKFGIAWQDALDQGIVYNALDACAKLGVDAAGLNSLWAASKNADDMIKFGGGFYCGKLDTEEPMYVFNGFFMSMRSAFVAPEARLRYFVVQFDSNTLSWEDFRGKVLGPTDPATAPTDSIRGLILAKWEELGLASEPNVGDNGVHASASPFEGLAERLNWLGVTLSEDPFGQRLLEAGISAETIQEWSVDPQVSWGDNTSSLFDALEDLDADDCVAKCVEINTN
eukprot:TRINITY_DN825_c0_g1_i1.p1 TRINITY_DN825_c0_g1~~TRINITY_DN825_c0_g1_i1.p1  ORF type:complete len:314 (-),score=95.56 TRINITY_DN825_c0_g1_i1:48-950(-)